MLFESLPVRFSFRNGVALSVVLVAEALSFIFSNRSLRPKVFPGEEVAVELVADATGFRRIVRKSDRGFCFGALGSAAAAILTAAAE